MWPVNTVITRLFLFFKSKDLCCNFLINKLNVMWITVKLKELILSTNWRALIYKDIYDMLCFFGTVPVALID